MTTGYAYHEVFGWHDTSSSAGLFPADPAAGLQPFVHLENAETKRRLHELVVVSGLVDHLVRIPTRQATDEEILRVHTPEHLARITAESELPKGGDAGDGISPFGRGGIASPGAPPAPSSSASTPCSTGGSTNAYALVRPPGHHAIAGDRHGVLHLRQPRHRRRPRQGGPRRRRASPSSTGTSTTATARNRCSTTDPDVLTISIHQDNVFPPNSGALDERARAPASGPRSTSRCRLAPATAATCTPFDEVVVPAVRAFRPDLVLVACGFDAGIMDPLARQMVTAGGFRAHRRAHARRRRRVLRRPRARCPTRAATTRSTCRSAGSPCSRRWPGVAVARRPVPARRRRHVGPRAEAGGGGRGRRARAAGATRRRLTAIAPEPASEGQFEAGDHCARGAAATPWSRGRRRSRSGCRRCR